MTGGEGDVRARWQPTRDVVARRMGGGVVLVNLASDRIYSLNSSAARLWEHVASRLPMRQVRARLAKEFRAPPGRLGRDIARMLKSMEAKGLLERRRSRVTP